jgi:hypothetical protein
MQHTPEAMATADPNLPFPPPAGGAKETPNSYLTSSLELRAGLVLRAIPPGALPLDELAELLRMQAIWAKPALRKA